MVCIALSDMSPKLPIGVATMYKPKLLLSISIFLIFIVSCTPLNLPKQSEESKVKADKKEQEVKVEEKTNIGNNISKNTTNDKQKIKDFTINEKITLLLSSDSRDNIATQFVNVLEIAIYNKNIQNIVFDIRYFENSFDLKSIILENNQMGKIFIGPIENKNTEVAKSLCNEKIIFFSFSSDSKLAGDCIYLLNFFPNNELDQLFQSLDKESKVALLYPENEYGYMINSLIDDIINKSNAVLVNRASYKNDLTNVRDAIKELGKYELRKYELDRQKKILYSKNDKESKERLKKLEKFKTTNDYDFTHILIADYGLNLLQVAPLLPYFDIDPNIVQFLGTGVIDDKNFFVEPSLQGTLFPGVELHNRQELIDQYKQIYDKNLLRISTLPYDLVGLLNYVFTKNMTINQTTEFLNNSKLKFDGIDGKFYFKDNMIERDLDILKILNGEAKKFN